MRCVSDKDLVSYLFSETDSYERKKIEEHFALCSKCELKIKTLRRAQAAAASFSPLPVSADFTNRLMKKLKTEYPIARDSDKFTLKIKALFNPARGLAFAAVTACLIAGFFFLDKEQKLPESNLDIIRMTDGPLVINKHLYPSENISTEKDAFTDTNSETIYTDVCRTAKCGLL